MRNFYKVLGIRSTADDARVKSAFRRRAKSVHPDLNPGDGRAEQRFKELTQAYEVLRNARARASYDTFLAERRSKVRRRIAGSVALMASTFTLTMGSAYVLLALSGAGVPTWQSSQRALEATASWAARRIDNAADAVAHVTATILKSATTAPEPRPSGTEIAKHQLPATEAREGAGKPEKPQRRADGNPSVERAKTTSQRKLEPEAPPVAKARKKLAANQASRRGRDVAERKEAAVQASRPTGETNRPWPTADEPFMALGATSR